MALGTGVHNLSLVVRATNRTRRAFQSVSRDLTLLDRTRQGVQRGFGQLSSTGLLAIKAMAVGVGVAVGGSVLAYSLFDDKLTKSLAITEDVSPKMRKELSDTAREVAKTTTFSANEAAEAYFHLFSSGLNAAQSMEALPVAAQFAQAGMFSLEEATEHLVTSQNALGLSFDDPIKNMREMQRVADVLAAVDQRAVGSIEEFSDALTNRAAAAMRTYGIEVEEGVAVLGAWAIQGLKGKAAGQAFAIVTRDLQKSALRNADAWRDNNVAVFDSQGNMRNMADIVGDLEGAMEGLTDAQKKQLLTDLGFQERSQQRLLQLLGTSDAIREFEEELRNAAGTAEQTANNQLKSLTKQLGLLWSAFVDVGIGIGEHFNEPLIEGVKALRDWINKQAPDWIAAAGRMIDKIGELIGKWQSLRTHFRLVRDGQAQLTNFFLNDFSPAMQVVIESIDKVIEFWRELSEPVRDAITDWGKLIPFIVLASGVLKGIALVMGVVAGPGAILAAVIAALIVGFKYLWENSEEFRAAIGRLQEFWINTVVPALREGWAIIQEKVAEFIDWFQTDVVPNLEAAWEVIQEAATAFAEFFETEILPWLTELWEQMQETFDAALEFISAVVERVTTFMTEVWDLWGNEIINIAEIAWGIISSVILGAWQILEGIFQLFTHVITGDWDKFWEGLWNILQGIWTIIWGFLEGIWASFLNLISGILSTVGIEWEDFWDGLKLTAATLWGNFVGWWNGVLDTFTSGWSTAWETLKGIVGGAFDALIGLAKNPLNAILGFLERMINNAVGGLNKLIDVANNVPGVNLGPVGTVSIPRLAEGGRILRQGLALIGERGPELLRLPRGAQVEPLPRVRDNQELPSETIIFQGTPSQMLHDWRRESKLRMAGL